MIQFFDNRATPASTPKTVARKQPTTATSSVFSMPITAAREWLSRDVYSIGCWLMS